MFVSRTICILIIAIIASDAIALRIIEWKRENHREVLTGEFKFTRGRDITLAFSSISGEGYNQLLIADAVKHDVIISYSFCKQRPIGYLQIGEFVFVENQITNEAFYLPEVESINIELDTYRDENVYNTAKQQQQSITKEYVLAEMHRRYDMTMLQHLSEAIGVEARKNEWDSTSTLAIYMASNSLSLHHATTNLTVGNEVCPNKKSQACVKKPIGRECLGLCGPGAHCSSWVCGDCCLHEGCYQHDMCCKKYGYLSSQCLSLWRFSCKHYDCS